MLGPKWALLPLVLPQLENCFMIVCRVFPTEPREYPRTFLAKYICILFLGENPANLISAFKYQLPHWSNHIWAKNKVARKTNRGGNSQSKFEREKSPLTLQILAFAKTNQFFSGPCFCNHFDSVIFSQNCTSLKTNKFKLARLSVVQRQWSCACLEMNNFNTLSGDI